MTSSSTDRRHTASPAASMFAMEMAFAALVPDNGDRGDENRQHLIFFDIGAVLLCQAEAHSLPHDRLSL
eukprot:CAMPEP_0198126852 /NCGR_PEP_ID=MMETSP1442-20131203/45917_1 /TAXON_ID= /ORGANISM="Craspedostauros australis, Strain CCMP3328" /LENGTH=68 /DNA_ID=CAMNT_0043786743 /DNA_START=230 /DNA_END=436 /DNA_ORIENTATION=+